MLDQGLCVLILPEDVPVSPFQVGIVSRGSFVAALHFLRDLQLSLPSLNPVIGIPLILTGCFPYKALSFFACRDARFVHDSMNSGDVLCQLAQEVI